MGVPVVLPSKTPESISTLSGSRRCVTCRDVPGLRRSRSRWMSSSDKARPGGQPSTTQPMAGPCDSPNDVTQKSLPKVLPDILFFSQNQCFKFSISLTPASFSTEPGISGVKKNKFRIDLPQETREIMKAIQMTAAGGTNVLAAVNIPIPDLLSPADVLVRVHAAGVNPIDTKVRKLNMYYPDRLPAVLGCDG